MTTPQERTRSLRWGWEYLLELQSSDSLSPQQLAKVDKLLLHYPSALDIKRWAALEDPTRLSDELAVKVENSDVESMVVPQEIERPHVFVTQYISAIVEAGLFFRSLLGAGNLPISMREQVQYVLRHYPQSYNIHGLEELIARNALKI